MASLDVDIENHTGRALVVEHRWEGVEGAQFVVPSDAAPRIVITITNLNPEDDPA